MSKKKLPQEFDLSELLDSLKEESKEEGLTASTTPVQLDNPVLSFLQAFGIQEGPHRVTKVILTKIFNAWYGHSLTARTVRKNLGLYLPHSTRLYFINKTFLELETLIKIYKEKSKNRSQKGPGTIVHFNKFLEQTGLAPGRIYVEIDVFFYVYNRWIDSTRKKSRFTDRSFKEICILDFDIKYLSKGNIPWVGVNSKIKELINKEEVKRWRTGRKNEQQTIYKEEYKKLVLYSEEKSKKEGEE